MLLMRPVQPNSLVQQSLLLEQIEYFVMALQSQAGRYKDDMVLPNGESTHLGSRISPKRAMQYLSSYSDWATMSCNTSLERVLIASHRFETLQTLSTTLSLESPANLHTHSPKIRYS